MRLSITALILAAMFPLQAQAPKYLVPTSNFIHAETVDLSALPEPPAPGSLAARADLEAILQLQAWRTPEQVAFAKRVDHLDAFDGAEALGPWFTRARLPLTAGFLEAALGDGEAMNLAAKVRYKRLRPPLQDGRVQPCTPVRKPETQPPPPSFYSYPSGHATSIHLLAGLLEELVPERREAIQAWAHRAAWSRMIAGVHFPSDAVGGELLAGITLKALKATQAFQESLARCRAEVAAARP